MAIYIKATQTISPQETFPGKTLPVTIHAYNSFLKCILPDFKQYYNPIQLRRMNTLIKSGNVCAIETIKEAGISVPDAIITGTGLGCIEDTEKFLHNVLDTNEGLVNPTAFIQSTHNAISAQVALHFKCMGYNILFAHKTISFESALLDALMLLKNKEAHNILVGGFDEITNENFELKRKINQFKQESSSNLEMTQYQTPGSIPGEGVTFFVLSDQPSSSDYAELCAVELLFTADDLASLGLWCTQILQKNKIKLADIDLLLIGTNGDAEGHIHYMNFYNQFFYTSTLGYYKNLCGEYDTASAFGMWFACRLIKDETIPSYAVLKKTGRSINTVLIYNQDNFKNHSLILLRKKR